MPNDRIEGRQDVPVANPLAGFLNDWMTPQDYALLKPGLAESFETRSDSNKSPDLPKTAEIRGGIDGLLLGGNASPAMRAPAARENPYLESLKVDLPATPAVTTARPSMPIAAPTPARAGIVAPPPPASVANKIPDFAKPPTDEKYFKPLKRF